MSLFGHIHRVSALRAQRCIQLAALISHPPPTYPDPPVLGSSHSSRYVPKTHPILQRYLSDQRRPSVLSALGSLPKNTSPTSELARRVEALPVLAENPFDATYSEEELQAFYDDLLALPNDETQVVASSSANSSLEEQDKAVVEAVISRISPLPSPPFSPETLSALLHQRAELPTGQTQAQHVHENGSSLPHHSALKLLTPIIQDLLTGTRDILADASEQDSLRIPLSILSTQEWRSLTRLCVRTCLPLYPRSL
jgi:hypothetical protein